MSDAGVGVEWRREQSKAGRLLGGWRVNRVRPGLQLAVNRTRRRREMACPLRGKQDGIRAKADKGRLGGAGTWSVGTEGEQ